VELATEGRFFNRREGMSLPPEPMQTELTMQQAAEVLNVSVPFLAEQLDQGLIPFCGDNLRRRVRLEDALAYKERIDRDRLKALEELAAQSQELGLGY
jgi:excisionase family DNA binding protein